MQDAIEQNTNGVRLLSSGSLSQAMACFKRSLQSLRMACNRLGDPPKLSTYDALPAAGLEFDLQGLGWSWSHVFVISRAGTGSSESYENYTIISAMVMFNMAVALQHRPTKTLEQRQESLLREYALLKNCLELMRVLPDHFVTEQTQVASAVLSTLADVCLQLGDAQGYRAALDALLVLSSRYSVLSDEEHSGESTIAPAA